jgi:aldehyde dehydrogenase (NAD+)
VSEFWDQGRNKADFGNIINENHHLRLKELLKEQHGGRVLIGGIVSGQVTPTIIVNPKMNSKMMQQEIFGPILPVLTFNDFNEVISIINNLEKPLVIYYFSKQHFGANFKLLET